MLAHHFATAHGGEPDGAWRSLAGMAMPVERRDLVEIEPSAVGGRFA
jgi:hypothetical protein